jgi:hypothetical protein
MSDNEIKVKGAFRLAIAENGEVLSTSDWYDNTITNEGFRNFLVRLLGGIASSSQITHMSIGTGGAPSAADTMLAGEQSVRAAVTAASSNTSKAVLFTATFASSASFVTAAKNISNLGLFAISTTNVGTLFAGAAFTSSTVATNQDVYASYSISFT